MNTLTTAWMLGCVVGGFQGFAMASGLRSTNPPPMTYTVSWYAQTTKAVIQRRPWWNVFGKDSLLPVTGWKRHVVTTDKKPDFETLRLIVSTFKSATHLQVEEGQPAPLCIEPAGSISTKENAND